MLRQHQSPMDARQHSNGQKNTEAIPKSRICIPNEAISNRDRNPQGGIISPSLANMTLDGIERMIKQKYWTNKKGTIDRDYNKHKVNYTRYADDFIVTAESQQILYDIKQMISNRLKQRGLTLSEEKTLTTHIMEQQPQKRSRQRSFLQTG